MAISVKPYPHTKTGDLKTLTLVCVTDTDGSFSYTISKNIARFVNQYSANLVIISPGDTPPDDGATISIVETEYNRSIINPESNGKEVISATGAVSLYTEGPKGDHPQIFDTGINDDQSWTIEITGNTVNSADIIIVFQFVRPLMLVRNSVISDKYGNVARVVEDGVLTHPAPHVLPDTSIHLKQDSGVTDTLAVAASKGDRDITVNSGGSWSVGNKFHLDGGGEHEYDHVTIKAIASNVLTLDKVLDSDYPIGASLTGININLAVDGSATNQVFEFAPESGKWHIHGINISIKSNSEPALGKFGGISALTYGLHFRVNRATGRNETYFIPIRTLNSLVLSGFFYEKEPKVLTDWFSHLKINFLDAVTSVIFLDGDAGDTFEAIVQDDTTGNASFEIKLDVHQEVGYHE